MNGLLRLRVGEWQGLPGLGPKLVGLAAKTMPLQVYYYLYQGNWFLTAAAATLMLGFLPLLGFCWSRRDGCRHREEACTHVWPGGRNPSDKCAYSLWGEERAI
jgi:hypothetical protein